MHLPVYVNQLKKEKRNLAVQNQQLQRVHQLQKQKADILQEENNKLQQKINRLEKDRKKLIDELEKTKAERDTYKNLTFKEKRVCTFPLSHNPTGRKRGGI